MLNWLHKKSLAFIEAKQDGIMAQFLIDLDATYAEGDEKQHFLDQCPSDEEYDAEEDEQADDLEYDLQLSLSKQDDFEYLRYNKVKSNSIIVGQQDSKQMRERLAHLKAKNDEKKQRNSLVLKRKQSSTYKDVSLKVPRKNISKSQDR